MTQELLKRRLIVGPIMAAVSVFAISATSRDMGWGGAFLPSVLVGVLGSFGFAWYLVRSERPQAHRPIAQVGAGFIVAASVIAMLLIRVGPSVLIYAVLVATLAMSLGYAFSSAYELHQGTYADTEHQQNRR